MLHLFGIPSFLFKVIGTSFVVWVLLTTILPQSITKYLSPEIRTNHYQSNYPYDSITANESIIRNSTIYYVIGHPDDEVMFFAPSILELNKPAYNNTLKLLCLSVGDAVDPSMGPIRANELRHSAKILGFDDENVQVLDKFTDSMTATWDEKEICQVLLELITEPSAVLITFDEKGVSNHPNHISLYHGTSLYYNTWGTRKSLSMYKLKTLNPLEKYSFTILTDIELFVDHISKLILSNILKFNINISFFNAPKNLTSLKIYSDLNMLSCSYAAMAHGHFSQMVWFRYGWLILSRYLTFNNLVQV